MSNATAITNLYFSQQSDPGFAFEAVPAKADIALSEPQPYYTAAFARAASDPDVRAARAQIAEPVMLAHSIALPDGPNSNHFALTVKYKNATIVGLPECFAFAFPMAKLVAEDLLTLYGPEKFKASKIELIIKRADLDKGEALRPDFQDWHDHMAPQFGTDLIYGFSNVLPTQFKTRAGKAYDSPAHALVRFGAEVIHRSQLNEGEPIRRTWGAFIVSFNQKPKNNEANNSALGDNTAASIERARTDFIVDTLKRCVVPLPAEHFEI
jgi:hypothetical protein